MTDTVEEDDETSNDTPKIPFVNLDPKHPITLTLNSTRVNKKIEIPQPSYQLEKLVAARSAEFLDEDPDEEDVAIFEAKETPSQANLEIDDEGGAGLCEMVVAPKRRADDWVHDATWVMECIAHVLPPPFESTPSATMAVQRELRAMLKEQKIATSLAELGWYVPPDQVGDNLFQWIVELHSFDETLPIAKDMKAKCVIP
jgi:ubiquitin-conjugating enzyme E2 Q